MNQQLVNILTIIVISFVCIYISGICSHLYESKDKNRRNPVFWALGIGFAGLGAGILLMLLEIHFLPEHIRVELVRMRRHHRDNITNMQHPSEQ